METYYIPEEATLPIPVTIDLAQIPRRSAIERWSIRRLVCYVNLHPHELQEIAGWRTGNNVLTDVLPNLESIVLMRQDTPYPPALMANKDWLREWEDPYIRELPPDCFRNSGLSYAYFGALNTVGDRCFYQTSHLTDLRIQWVTGTALNVGEDAFAYSGINNFTTSAIAGTIINAKAFEACYHLTSLYLTNTINIPNRTFNLCRNMVVLYLPKTTSIGTQVFNENYCLRSLTVGPNCAASAASFATVDTKHIDLFIPTGSTNGNPNPATKEWYTRIFKSINFI